MPELILQQTFTLLFLVGETLSRFKKHKTKKKKKINVTGTPLQPCICLEENKNSIYDMKMQIR